jgi:hypothetical protein
MLSRSRVAIAPLRKMVNARTMSYKDHPQYETYKERIVYTVLIVSCVLSSFPLLVPDSYFIKQMHDHDEAAKHEEEDDEEEE